MDDHGAAFNIQIENIPGVQFQGLLADGHLQGGHPAFPPHAAVFHGLGKVLVLHGLDEIVGAVEREALAHEVLRVGEEYKLTVLIAAAQRLRRFYAGDTAQIDVHKYNMEAPCL